MNINMYNKTGLFFALSTILPWFFWFLAGYISHAEPATELMSNIASIVAFIGLLTPLVITISLAWGNKSLIQDLKDRIINFKAIKMKYLLLTLLLMLTSILFAQAISLFFGYSVDQFQLADSFSFSSGVFSVWFMLIIAPLLEELAWHSYGTDSLRSKYNLFNTSIIFALFWGVWHFPLSFIKDYYHSNLVETGTIYSINFIVSLIPFVIIMNWIYYKTDRNIILPIIFHITAGYFNEVFNTHPISKVIQTGLLLVLSVYIIFNNKDFFFSKQIANKKERSNVFSKDKKVGFISILAIFGLFIFSSPTHSSAEELTQNIIGKVIDYTTNEPLPFASVVVVDSDPFIGDAADLD